MDAKEAKTLEERRDRYDEEPAIEFLNKIYDEIREAIKTAPRLEKIRSVEMQMPDLYIPQYNFVCKILRTQGYKIKDVYGKYIASIIISW